MDEPEPLTRQRTQRETRDESEKAVEMEMTLIGPHRCPYTENLFFYIIKQENRSDSVVLPLFFFFFSSMKISRLNYSSRQHHTQTRRSAEEIFLLTCALAKGRLIYPRQYHQRVVYNPPRSIFLSNHIGGTFSTEKKEEEDEEKFEGKRGRPQTTFD